MLARVQNSIAKRRRDVDVKLWRTKVSNCGTQLYAYEVQYCRGEDMLQLLPYRGLLAWLIAHPKFEKANLSSSKSLSGSSNLEVREDGGAPS